MRERGFLLSSEPAKRGSFDPRCFQRSSTCRAPKGAAARCCSLKALGWAWKERLWYVAPFLLVKRRIGGLLMSPHCVRCNRKIHNRVQCRICSQLLCSEACFEKHCKTMHANVLIAKAKEKLEQLKRQ